MSLTQTVTTPVIQEITDYRVIHMPYPFNTAAFINTVNEYLKKGYILKGSLKTIGESLSQVVIKCALPSSDPVVETYEVIGVRDNNIITLERTVMDALRNGWSLYGDHHYSQNKNYSSDYNYIWQTLVKYKKTAGNPFDGFS
jgi:hypothetical protein